MRDKKDRPTCSLQRTAGRLPPQYSLRGVPISPQDQEWLEAQPLPETHDATDVAVDASSGAAVSGGSTSSPMASTNNGGIGGCGGGNEDCDQEIDEDCVTEEPSQPVEPSDTADPVELPDTAEDTQTEQPEDTAVNEEGGAIVVSEGTGTSTEATAVTLHARATAQRRERGIRC